MVGSVVGGAGISDLRGEALGGDGEETFALEADEAPAGREVEFAADPDQRHRAGGDGGAGGDGEQGEDAPVVLAQAGEMSGGLVVGFAEARGALPGDPGRLEGSAGRLGRREHGPEDEAERADGRVGEAAGEREEIFGEGRERVVEARADGFEGYGFVCCSGFRCFSGFGLGGVGGAEHHAGQLAGPEGDPHPGCRGAAWSRRGAAGRAAPRR